MKRLAIIKLGRKHYFIDERLGEIRNVRNPHDSESVPRELIDFWKEHEWRIVVSSEADLKHILR